MSEPLTALEDDVTVSDSPTPSFDDFFFATHADLFGALCLITRNRHEAEEIMQDAYLKIWERWERVAELEDPTGYLYRTAMNAFRHRLRRAKLALKRAVHLTPQDDTIEGVDEREAVIRALAPLTPQQRAAIVLTNLLDYTSEEAADLLGMNAGAVRTLASRGRAELRRKAGESP